MDKDSLLDKAEDALYTEIVKALAQVNHNSGGNL